MWTVEISIHFCCSWADITNCYSKERKVLAVGMKFGRDIHSPRKAIIVLLFGWYDVQLFSRGLNCLW